MVFEKKCPCCKSKNLGLKEMYTTMRNGQRKLLFCRECKKSFSETHSSPAAGLRTSISRVAEVLQSRTEGMSFNAACRIFKIGRNTLNNWEKRFASTKKVLFLYSLCHSFLEQIIEGDELYTKVNQNKEPAKSEGWTIVLMERVSRFIWHMECGRKDKKLFKKAMATLARLIDKSTFLTLITDGEKSYGARLFEVCHEMIMTGKPGRPKKTLKKGVRVALKNKGKQNHKKGPKKKKYERPWPEHPDTNSFIENREIQANRLEASNASTRRTNSAYRRKTNTYAKIKKGLQRVLDLQWINHNFIKVHFTTKEVPAVSQGIFKNRHSFEDIMMISVYP